jgi:hypothetical protein
MMWRKIQIWLITHPGSWLIDYICADVPSGHRGDLAALVGVTLGQDAGAKWQRVGNNGLYLWYQGDPPSQGYTREALTADERSHLAALGEWDAADVDETEWARLTDAAPVEDPDA